MGHVSRFVALLLLAATAHAQGYYEKTDVPPNSAIYVEGFGARGNGTTDNATAFSAAIARANALCAAGTQPTIHLGQGRFYINAAITQFARYCNARIQGAGMYQTSVVVGSGLTGNVFSWDDAWSNSGTSVPAYTFGTAHNGGGIADLSMMANTGSGAQNAIVCLDRCDDFLAQNIAVWDFNGSAISMGTANLTTVGFMRESKFYNLHLWHNGSATAPALNISSVTDSGTGNNESTNELKFYGVDIYYSNGVGLAINNQTIGGATTGTRYIQFHGLQVENSRGTYDLIKIGDGTANGKINNVLFYGLEENTVPASAYGVHITGTTNNIDSIKFEGGGIFSGPGGGISVDVGSYLTFRDIYFSSSLSTALTVGASTNISCCVRVEGATGYPTTSIDASSSDNVIFGGGQTPSTGPLWSFDSLGNETVVGITLSKALTSTSARSGSALFGTTGVRTIIGGANVTDTSSSGTITSTYLNKINGDVLLASSPTTLTNAYTLDIEPPTAGANVTCTTCGSLRLGGQLQANGLINGQGGLTMSGAVTTTGGNASINANTNNTVNIGTGTNNQAVTIGGTSNTTTITNAVLVGTTAAGVATAGSQGEVASINCVVGAAAAAATAVSTPIASPGVVTWASHTFVPSTSLANYTCPINFTGSLPTGLVVGTNYWIIGSTVSGDTFQVADTAAHALAGTNAVNFTVSAGSPSAYIGALGSTGTVFAGAGLSLVAGDWDCSAVSEYQELTAITSTRYISGISTSGTAVGAIGTFTDNHTVTGSIGSNSQYYPSPLVQENVSGTTTLYTVDSATFSGGTMNEGGRLYCRRMR